MGKNCSRQAHGMYWYPWGAKGAVLLTEDGQILEKDAPGGTLVNSVGAGDSMVAGFLAGYEKYKDYEKALWYGLCAGSASACGEGLATGAPGRENACRKDIDIYLAVCYI